MNRETYEHYKEQTLLFFEKAHIILTEKEKDAIEVADFGLNRSEDMGLQLITYINTERVCSKEMVLLPKQACPEHRHPDFKEEQGKEETFRCRWGEVYLYVEGKGSEHKDSIQGSIPSGCEEYFTVFHEIVLHPGEQYTIYPNTRHWFQGGENGAVVSEFSTKSTDEADIFTDPNIIRAAIVL